MPDSQFQRPGALLVPSHTEKVRELLNRARDLESQLATLGKLDEDKAAQLRSHLCEVISDLIITDPAVSREHDMATTLWRSCFYIPICSFRKEISKVKRRKGSSPAAALEHQFKKFLSEALALYDYLSIQYQSKLMPGLTQTNSQDISQESELPCEHESTVGVVEGLYRLFIYTGDLHRYAESYDKAITCYLSATKLSPGNGNPYNQLAVVSQMKDPYLSMNALYWYCRSLLATHSSFETSSNNLERLFTSNREHLQEHSRGEPPIFVPDKKNPLTSAQKQAAVKSCLSHFVDFHFDILQQANESTLRAKLAGIFKSLESLLEASAFSDQLLFKLVIINAFGIEKCNNDAHRTILVEFMLQLGQTFSDRLLATMAKMLEKPNDPKQLSSIRLLLPLLVIVELLARQGDCALADEYSLFWAKVASVGTLIRRYSLRIDAIDEQAEPEEFQTLKGYRPYKFLKPEYVAGSPFVDENEAVLVLGLQATQTQSSKIDTKNEETKARMVAFVRLCDSCCARDNIVMHFDGDAYMCRPDQPELTSNTEGHEAEGDQEDADMEVEPDDDGGDVVTCTSPGTPAPVDFSSSGLPLNSRSEETQIRKSDPSKPVGVENPQPPPVAVMPPPGFGFRDSVACGTRRELDSAVGGCMAPPPPPPRYNLPSVWPTGPQHNMSVDDMLTYNQQQQLTLPREETWNGIMLPTQNPFATPMPRTMPTQNWSQAQQEAFTPIADMLGSGLLESIFMSDSPSKETRNPFAW